MIFTVLAQADKNWLLDQSCRQTVAAGVETLSDSFSSLRDDGVRRRSWVWECSG